MCRIHVEGAVTTETLELFHHVAAVHYQGGNELPVFTVTKPNWLILCHLLSSLEASLAIYHNEPSPGFL